MKLHQFTAASQWSANPALLQPQMTMSRQPLSRSALGPCDTTWTKQPNPDPASPRGGPFTSPLVCPAKATKFTTTTRA